MMWRHHLHRVHEAVQFLQPLNQLLIRWWCNGRAGIERGGNRGTDLTDEHQIGGLPEGGFRALSDFGERVFEEQVFAQEEEDAGTGTTAQHDEDSGHGTDPQWIRFVQTVDVRTFEARNSLVPERERW